MAERVRRGHSRRQAGSRAQSQQRLRPRNSRHCIGFIGKTENGIREIELALQLNPRTPESHFINTVARAHLVSRRYEKAIERAREAIVWRSNFPHAYYILASALGHLGRADDARAALKACENIQPGFVVRRASWAPYRNETDNQHILEGIRKAGLQD